MPTKTSAKTASARVSRKPAAKALAVHSRKRSASKAAARNRGLHLRHVLFAGIAAAAAVSALAFLPDSVSGGMKKKVREKGKAARASINDAEKMMKQAIEAARNYASNALH